MPQGLQTVLALLLLLPGFISARIVRLLTPRSQQSELERITEALTFSFLVYVAYFFIFGSALPVDWKVTAGTAGVQVLPHRWRILCLLLLAIVLGFLWGVAKARDWVLKALRRGKVTERTSRESVWNDVFLSFNGTVQVGLADGRMVIGWLRRYSETNDERSLFIERASWVSETGEIIAIPGEGLLLTEKSDIHFVMFLGSAATSNTQVQPLDL